MSKTVKFRKFNHCPKCDAFFGFSEYDRINTIVRYRRAVNALLCTCMYCGYEWYEFTKEDKRND